MKNSVSALIVFAVTTISHSALAASPFCAPQAVAAAQSLANVNGTILESASFVPSADGRTFSVSLTENGDVDRYIVKTSGGHDCVVRSVKVVGEPTLRP